VGSADIQSLADLSNSFKVVATMRLAPVTGGPSCRPWAPHSRQLGPLALTMMPLEALLKTLFGLLF